MHASPPASKPLHFLTALKINATAVAFAGFAFVIFGGFRYALAWRLSSVFSVILLWIANLLPGLLIASVQIHFLRPGFSRKRAGAYCLLTISAFPAWYHWFILCADTLFPFEETLQRMDRMISMYTSARIILTGLLVAQLIPAAVTGCAQMILVKRLRSSVGWSLSLWVLVSIIAVFYMWIVAGIDIPSFFH